MNTILKTGLLAATFGLATHMAPAEAAVATHYFYSNSVNYCQAFTPGISNTIRNRVLGAENVGGSAIAVACNFHWMSNGGTGSTNPTSFTMYFANNGDAPITVTCTMLTGYQSQGGTNQYAVTKTTGSIAGGGNSQGSLSFTSSDNPNSGATTLGAALIGVNCTLPTGAVINDTFFRWTQDNGI